MGPNQASLQLSNIANCRVEGGWWDHCGRRRPGRPQTGRVWTEEARRVQRTAPSDIPDHQSRAQSAGALGGRGQTGHEVHNRRPQVQSRLLEASAPQRAQPDDRDAQQESRFAGGAGTVSQVYLLRQHRQGLLGDSGGCVVDNLGERKARKEGKTSFRREQFWLIGEFFVELEHFQTASIGLLLVNN